MTVDIWRACLHRYMNDGNSSERIMARLLWEISMVDEKAIVAVFDRYASEILEAAL